MTTKQVFCAIARSELAFAFADGTTLYRSFEHHLELEVGNVITRIGLEGETVFVVDDIQLVHVDVDPEAPNCSPCFTKNVLLREVEPDPTDADDPPDNRTTVTTTE